ncbi:MAG: CPBP family intramembrane metalloprotease [Candidatus Marinimicrobia bacterium]|nr:CPBP family intramembrane metalloprotease [Candidatus Neomarinimicrobiota bacterium]
MAYLSSSKTPLYSLIYVLPAALFYEISIFIVNNSDIEGVRNSADILFKRLIEQIGFEGFEASILLFFIIFVAVSFVQGIKLKKGDFNWVHFPLIIMESTLYAAFMVILFSYILRANVTLSGAVPEFQHIVFSVGAGVYEEILFRGILLQGLIFLLARVEGSSAILMTLFSVLLTSLIFVGIHYIGPYGDAFSFISFFIRFVASLILSGIYLWRGFALAAYSHIFYDIFVILI